MNQFVPEFDMDEDYSISLTPSSGLPKQKNMQQDDIFELLWQNGHVVVQNQNQRFVKKPSPPPTKFQYHQLEQEKQYLLPPSQLPAPDGDSTAHLAMQDEDMIPWLRTPLVDPSFDRDFTDLFYLPPGPPPSTVLRPPPPPLLPASHLPFLPEPSATEIYVPHFSGTATRFPESGPSSSSMNNEIRYSMVDSSDTPAMRQKLNIPIVTRNGVEAADRGKRICDSFVSVTRNGVEAADKGKRICDGFVSAGGGAIAGNSAVGGGIGNACLSLSREIDTCDLTLTSSLGGSAAAGASQSGTATGDLMNLLPADDRKGKRVVEHGDEANTDYQSEDLEIESYEPMKKPRPTNKRSRAAEVHNLSERKRRDRINEKMRALQNLIPRCSKTDKASMLDEAIGYMKSLQMQVQMMSSMGCGMVPMMFPGLHQQYMSSMGMSSMGMGMGMGMGMEMGMARPMMPFPGALSNSAMPTPAGPSHMTPKFPLPPYPVTSFPGPDPSRIEQATNQQQAIQQMQLQMQMQSLQNQQNSQPSIGKPNASRVDNGNGNPKTG